MFRFVNIFRRKQPVLQSSDGVEQVKTIIETTANTRSAATNEACGVSTCSSLKTATTVTSSVVRATYQIIEKNDFPVVEVSVDQTPAHIKTVKCLMDTLNSHDAVALQSFFTEDAFFVCEDHPPLPFSGLLEIYYHSNTCMPDGKWSYDSIKRADKDVIVVEAARFTGTHTGTGTPFSPPLSPDQSKKLPPIPAKGDFVAPDEERYFFHFIKDGKIKSWTIISLGPCTGPMGVYEQLQDAA